MVAMGALDPTDKIPWGHGPHGSLYTSYIVEMIMEIYTAQYTVRCNNNISGLLCNLKITMIKSSSYVYAVYIMLLL